ncbi:MAG TPA: YtxH domain-containing protein [Chitinophagaceae bacterium]|nr:YtxH domain-containing protein [Chitinophagaceae bacterium]
MSTGKVILGLIAGGCIGAIAGILLAPDSGIATRQKIADHTSDLKGLLSDWANDFVDSLTTADDNITTDQRAYAPEMKLNTMG